MGLLLFVVCLSGSFATLANELDGLVDARHRIASSPAASPGPLAWTAMHETLEATFPDGEILGVYAPGASANVPGGRTAAALAFVAMPTGESRKAYLDPYTGELRGHTSFFNAQRFFRTFHRRFFDGTRGIVIVTLTGFSLLASGITGFLFYKGWIKQLFSLRLRGSRRRRWSELHKVAGIWGLPFTILIAVTGIYYFVEVVYQSADAYGALLPPPMAQVDEARLAEFGPQPELLPMGAYVDAARRAFPELDVRSVRTSHDPALAVYVDGQAGNPLTRDRADRVHLHPYTGEVIDIQRTSDLGLVAFTTDAVDPLHFGYFGGLATQVVWFVLGLVLSFSILSGMYVWVVRSVTARRGPSGLLRGAPIAVGSTLVYLVLVGFATMDGIRAYAPRNADPVAIGRTDVGPYHVRIDCGVPCTLEEGAILAARFEGRGLPNYERAELSAADGSSTFLGGPSWRPRGAIAVAPGAHATLRVTMRDGEVHEGSFVPSVPATPAAPSPVWPDAAPGVWWIVIGFTVLTVGSIVAWLAMVWRVARAA